MEEDPLPPPPDWMLQQPALAPLFVTPPPPPLPRPVNVVLPPFRASRLAACAPMGASAQFSQTPDQGPPTKTTFIRLGQGAPAVLYEPVAPGAKAGIGTTVMAVGAITACNWPSSRADFSGGIDTAALSQKSWQFAWERLPRWHGSSAL